MKKNISLLIALVLLLPLSIPHAFATYTEKAQVIKEDKDNLDLLIKRQNGKLWLLQHNRQCTSMTTEFPVDIIVDGEKITTLKVDFNEECTVYNSSPYSGEGKFVKLIDSPNIVIPAYQAEIIWENKKYLVDYTGSSCKNLRDYVNKRIYFYFPTSGSNSGTIIIPNNGGECNFTFNKIIEIVDNSGSKPGKIKNLNHQAQDSQIYFYWDPPITNNDISYVISYSKYKLDINNYTYWKEMPNTALTNKNNHIVKLLLNEQKYYFYIAAWQNDMTGEWTELEATPVTPKPLSEAYYKALETATGPLEDSIMQKSQIVEAKAVTEAKEQPKKTLLKYFASFYSSGKYVFFKSLQLLK